MCWLKLVFFPHIQATRIWLSFVLKAPFRPLERSVQRPVCEQIIILWPVQYSVSLSEWDKGFKRRISVPKEGSWLFLALILFFSCVTGLGKMWKGIYGTSLLVFPTRNGLSWVAFWDLYFFCLFVSEKKKASQDLSTYSRDNSFFLLFSTSSLNRVFEVLFCFQIWSNSYSFSKCYFLSYYFINHMLQDGHLKHCIFFLVFHFSMETGKKCMPY